MDDKIIFYHKTDDRKVQMGAQKQTKIRKMLIR